MVWILILKAEVEALGDVQYGLRGVNGSIGIHSVRLRCFLLYK